MRRISLLLAFLALLSGSPAAAQEADLEAMLADRVLGDPAAPVTIIAYESLTCPHCAAFHRETFDALKERYIDSGQVKLIYRDFPLNAPALRASMLARCTDERRFYGMLEVLFRTQEQWAKDHDVVGALGRLGKLAGLSDEAIEACMTNEALLDGIVRIRRDGEQAGVSSTPTFIINDQIYAGNRSLDEFARILDPLLPSN
ncbi:MAG: DsbA family protein [Alphaproteobacteria bacterium]